MSNCSHAIEVSLASRHAQKPDCLSELVMPLNNQNYFLKISAYSVVLDLIYPAAKGEGTHEVGG